MLFGVRTNLSAPSSRLLQFIYWNLMSKFASYAPVMPTSDGLFRRIATRYVLALLVLAACSAAWTDAHATTQYEAQQQCIAFRAYQEVRAAENSPPLHNNYLQDCAWSATVPGVRAHAYVLVWENEHSVFGPSAQGFSYDDYPDCVPPSQPGPNLACNPPPPPAPPPPDKQLGDPPCPPGSCPPKVGNPINTATGNKFQAESDFAGTALLQFVRFYNSAATAPTHLLGAHWTNTYTRRIAISSSTVVVLSRPDGSGFAYQLDAGVWQGEAGVTARLQQHNDQNGVLSGWTYREQDDREVETYDAQGRLVGINRADGQSIVLVYNNGLVENNANDFRLTSVTAQDGRTLQLSYDAYLRLNKLIDPNGTEYLYAYDASGRLQSVTYPSATGKTYVYNESAYTAGADLPMALTGIVDEKGQRFATFSYGSDGLAISTEHTGGVEKFSMVYNSDGTTSITKPAGVIQQRSFVAPTGINRTSAISETAFGVTRSSSYTFDASGNTDLVTDALGAATDYDFNARGLVTQRIDSANKPTTKRTSQTDWHAEFEVPVEGRILNASGALEAKTTWAYNSRGQVLTSTQVDLHSGPSRVTTMSYCEQAGVTAGICPLIGLLTAIDGPRSDVSDVSTLAYYASDDATCASSPTSCPHRKGDLWKVTNGAGQATQTLAYDGTGRPLTVLDANGVTTNLEYTARGWPSARKVRGTDNASEVDDAITRLDYDPVGQIIKLTEPDGSYAIFTYDDAHRLTDITDAMGNSQHFALDNSGNRFSEQTKDAGGAIKHSLSRVYDSLGQLKTLADAYATPTDFSYDLAGNPDTSTDSLSRITDQDVDPLGRLIKVIANTTGSASDKATTQFQYDARDNLKVVTDPKGLNTSYAYNDFSDLVQLTSPDTGTSSFSYDAAGNRLSQLDARGKSTGYGYDMLNRLTSQAVPTAAQNVYFDYDLAPTDCAAVETFGAGRLARVRDESGSTRYCYDRRGNLVRKVQTVVGGSTLTVAPTYNSSDRLIAMTYPSGAIVTLLRDANGQVRRVDAVPKAGGAQVLLVDNVSYLPFGPLTSLTFGNGRILTKAYDANYGIDKVSDSATSNPLSEDFTLNPVGNVIGLTERTTAIATVNRTLAYDGLDRLTSQKNGATNIESFHYDSTGDRQAKTVGNSATAYSYASLSHRLSSVGSVARTYDANGNTTAIDTSNKGQVLSFDDRNRLRDLKIANKLKASYRYNGKGERVLRTDATPVNSRQYVYDQAGHLLGEYTTAGARIQEYVWLDDTLVAILSDHDASTYQYVETDNLGTPRAVIHPGKNTIIWRWDVNNSAFGEHLPAVDPDANRLNYTLNLRFPGQVFDSASGLSYNFLRDAYDSATGRYVQSDPIGLAGGTSTYGYADQSPFSTVDPLGLFGFRDAAGFVPILGSGLDSYDAFRCGNIGAGLFHAGLALVDATGAGAVAKGLTVGAFRLAARESLKAVYKEGRSMAYRNVRKRMLSRGLLTKNVATHHWWYKQAEGVSDFSLNAPWNLMPDISDDAHYLAHHGGLAERVWYGTPGWLKASVAGATTFGVGLFADSGCGCR